MPANKVDVVIVGAGLTGLTLAFYLQKGGKKVALVEKSDRLGGAIQTIHEKEFVYEMGPNTGVIGTEGIVQLFDDLKEHCELITPDPVAKERWILKKGQWEPLPSGLLSAIGTPLFSFKDKCRILGEPWRKKGTDPDETLAQLVKRRLGKSFLNYAVDPFISGIYAGDPTKLITRFALPKLYNLEQKYGSFIKGSIQKRKEPRTELQKRVSREVFSVKGGLQNLITALENNISKDSVFCGCQQIKVSKHDKGFSTELNTIGGEQFSIESDKVITTFGGQGIGDVLPFLPLTLLKPVADTTYAKVVQVVVGYKHWDGKNIKAFGGLVPSVENKDILGILFPGTLFSGRCPAHGALLSVFVGGMKKPHMIVKSDEEIQQMVLREIELTLQCDQQPDLINVFRYPKAIPQYDISTKERYAAIHSIEKEYSGLYLAGNIKGGIGMADRVQQAWDLAKALLDEG
ncbi:oxygen-dependent protoporphyrinogen oxidase [Saccharicrinis carchari]|uniref:Coproporphyrinogen III oxidase n=2 Tax=Saccharicrinis carchari TaxID=1168039 RepID=A0A521AW01_SACCC|nr:oxygen-dependent protoporphyrinogen oxidase [Saccharicrinis carchari]